MPACSRWRLARRIMLFSGLALVIFVTVATAAAFIVGNHLINSIPRVSGVFRGLNPADRPPVPAAYSRSLTILVVGSDSGSPTALVATGRDRQYSDAIMLVHINSDGRAASVISIPRNAWIGVPGHGMTSLYRVLALGGPPLLVRTIEQLTGVRVDHYAVINFAGLRDVVRALGTVPVDIAEPSRREGIVFRKGVNDLGPRAAWVYVTSASRSAGCRCWQRDGLPGGDLSRVQRQQNLIRAILIKTAETHLLTDPLAAYRLIGALRHAVSIDGTFSDGQLLSLAQEAGQLHGSDLIFLTVPVRRLGWRDHEGVVYLDRAAGASLWNAVRHDGVAAWAARHPATLTPQVPY